MPRAQILFGALVLAQAAHSVEEYVGRLWEVFPPARLLTGLVSTDREAGFLVLTVGLLLFGLWCYAWPVRRRWPAAVPLMWGRGNCFEGSPQSNLSVSSNVYWEMTMTRTLTTLALTAALCGHAAHAQQADARASMLVTPAELAASLDDPKLVLLHVGDKPEYDAAHIPGARYASLRDLSVAEGHLVLQMPGADDLKARLEALGISDDSRVVVYFGKDWVSPSTRVVFTIAHAGLERVALLDGGMPAWTKAGHPVTDIVPGPRAGRLARVAPSEDIVDAAFLQENIGQSGFALIDARDAAFFDGTREGGPRDLRVAGHISGAISVPFSSVTTSDLTLKPRAELEAIFSKAGVKPGDTLVTYCHIGQQATAVLFAARTLGYRVLLYDGSFEDWVRRGLAVRNPAKKSSR